MPDSILHFRTLGAPTIKLNAAWYCADCDAIVEGSNLVTCPVCSGVAVWSFLELMAEGTRRKRRKPRAATTRRETTGFPTGFEPAVDADIPEPVR